MPDSNICKPTDDGRLLFICPGCRLNHQVPVEGPHAWLWNGSLSQPTFSPSILVQYGPADTDARCHSFVANGMIQFLPDCSHELKGQTVPLPAWGS